MYFINSLVAQNVILLIYNFFYKRWNNSHKCFFLNTNDDNILNFVITAIFIVNYINTKQYISTVE